MLQSYLIISRDNAGDFQSKSRSPHLPNTGLMGYSRTNRQHLVPASYFFERYERDAKYPPCPESLQLNFQASLQVDCFSDHRNVLELFHEAEDKPQTMFAEDIFA